jgi:hypothetical protein
MQPAKGPRWINFLAFYLVPNGPGRSTVFFQGFLSERGRKMFPLRVRLARLLRPLWCALSLWGRPRMLGACWALQLVELRPPAL